MLGQPRNLVADSADLILQLFRSFAAAPLAADLLAQSLAIGVQLLQRRLGFAAFCIRAQELVDPGRIIAATRREPRLHKVRLFANETNVEHARKYQGRAGKATDGSARSACPPHVAIKPRDNPQLASHISAVEQLNLLGVALGLAALAGINLYLTVFVTGLAVNQHWITLAPQYQSLEVLGHPVIITIAGILYFLEFFADKIPWVDSAWDAVHTVIRPIGGALLAIQVLGHSSPTFDVVVLLLAGGTSLIAHTAKASTRLVANTSPEPFSNIGLSLAEDAAVFGGLALIHYNPLSRWLCSRSRSRPSFISHRKSCAR